MTKLVSVLKRLILPPTGLILIGCISFFGLGGRWDGWAKAGVAISLAGLYVLSTPLVSMTLLNKLEKQYRQVTSEELAGALKGQRGVAIVVLDSGRDRNGTESEDDDTPNQVTLARLAVAARAHRATGLPILVSGDGAGPLMADSLREDFDVPVRWIEPESHDTAANARLSAVILKAENVRHVVLVTHAWHMPRAVDSFHRTGLRVTPVPTAMTTAGRQDIGLFSVLPSAFGLSASYLFYHELLGRFWYRIRYGPAPQLPTA